MPTYRSPAKINLFLRVLGKRPDGYHELSTLMQTIGLCDLLKIHFTTGPNQFLCSNPDIPSDESNLVMKAVNLFHDKTKIRFNVDIHLEKHIPPQAGLGGGSSNAATTLWALNQLLGEPATHEELVQWAAELGSDVPFFLSSGTAICTGRGEIIESLAPLPNSDVWILKPDQGLSTPEVFGNLDLKKLDPISPKALLELIYKGSPAYHNDLESPAFHAMPMLAQIKEILMEQGFHSVTLSGTGSALYFFGKKRPPIIENSRAYHTHFINRSETQWY